MSQPVTTNPLLIAAINMTVVFAVLYGLSLVIRLIRFIDPTQKKKPAPPEVRPDTNEEAVPSAGSAEAQLTQEELMIIFTAAVAAYSQGGLRVTAFRPTGGDGWSRTARMESVSTRNRMF